MDSLYDFFRASSGFSLIVAGISLLISPGKPQVFLNFGRLFLCTGGLFSLSSLDPTLHLIPEISNFLVIFLVYLLSQALFEISLFVFGGTRRPGISQAVWQIGAAWSALLWMLPFLDYLLVFGTLQTNVEDGLSAGFFHNITDWAIYLWPLGILTFSLTLTRWNLSDLSGKSRAIRPLVGGLIGISIVLGVSVVAIIANSLVTYRLAHTLLELFLLLWYFFVVRHPDAFLQFRTVVQTEHQRKLDFDESEAKIIQARLQRLVKTERIFLNPLADLAFLAKHIQVPPYRLSRYFNRVLHISFSEWLNRLRIEYVSQELRRRPEARVLELAQEAGYSTKAIFNTQFRKITGVSPSEFRKD